MSWRQHLSDEIKPSQSSLGKHERMEARDEAVEALTFGLTRIFPPPPFADALAMVGDTQLQLTLAEVRALRHAAMDRADWRAHCRERRLARRRARHLKSA